MKAPRHIPEKWIHITRRRLPQKGWRGALKDSSFALLFIKAILTIDSP
jgi:hypothetical protein